MGAVCAKPSGDGETAGVAQPGGVRVKAITGGAVKGKATLPKLPANALKAQAEDVEFIEVS